MIQHRYAGKGEVGANDRFPESAREEEEDNLAWLQRQLRGWARKGKSYVVLLGGSGPAEVAVRMAQSATRHDFTPSRWSHVLLLRSVGGGSEWSGEAWDLPMRLEERGHPRLRRNAVVDIDFADYRDPRVYPNIGAFALPVGEDRIDDAVERFKRQRATFDAPKAAWVWLGYILGLGQHESPLYRGVAHPSAAMVQFVYGAADFDLTPNEATAHACPETMWQAVRWWYEWWERDRAGSGGEKGSGRVHGAYTAPHAIAPEPG